MPKKTFCPGDAAALRTSNLVNQVPASPPHIHKSAALKNTASVADPLMGAELDIHRVRHVVHHIPLILSPQAAKENSFHAKICAEGFQSTPQRSGGRRPASAYEQQQSADKAHGIRTFEAREVCKQILF